MRILSTFLVGVFLLCTSAFAQVHTVIGRVLDENGKPIPFASIKVKGTRGGVAADQDGAFQIHAATGAELIITATAYDPVEAKVTPSGDIKVVLKVKNSSLQEVVVTAFGVQRQSKELGYSTARVSGKDVLTAQPISAANGLTGKVAGLQINTVNNEVFAPTRITLRGMRSLTGNNQPLIIVDGAIYYNDISTLNPNDITDINVLKGASASAVYGSDASNGVIIITTKKGTRGRPNISFTTTTQVETVAYMPAFQSRFGSNGGEKWINDFNDLSTAIPYENQAYGPAFRSGAYVPIGRLLADSSYQYIPYSAVKNQKKDFFNHALTTQNNLSYSAGDDNSRFYLSAQDVNTKGVMPMDAGRRDAFRAAGSRTYGKFTADFTIAYTYKYETQGANDATAYDDVLNTPADIPLSSYKNWATNKYATPSGYFNDYYMNPYYYLANNRTNTTTNSIQGNLHLALHPLPWLNLSYRLAVNQFLTHNDTYSAGVSYSKFSDTSQYLYYSNPAGNGVNLQYGTDGTRFASASPASPSYSTYYNNNLLWNSDFLASVDQNITKNLNFKATLGTTYDDNKITNTYTNAGTLFFPVYNVNNLTGILNGGGSTFASGNAGNYYLEARKLGLFGEGSLGFKSFLFVHGSYRSDIDSRLSKSNRFIPYYDIDGSLIVSDLVPSLFTGKDLSFLKIHGAHSKTGNASPLGGGSQYIAGGAYQTDPTLTGAGGFPFSGVGGYQLNLNIANPNIKPEFVTENEVGLEIGFLQNRFNLGATGYISNLKDGIINAPIPPASGFTNALINAANTQNKGLEFELKGDVFKTKDWDWYVNVNWTHSTNLVKSINGGQQSVGLPGSNANSFAVVGYAFPVIETYDWVRDPAGQVIVDPVTGMPTKSSSLSILGNANPKDVLGVTTNLAYKAFTLTVTADYRGGYKIFNAIGESMDFSGNGLTTAATGRQRFVFPNSVIQEGGKYVTNTNVTVDDANFNFWPSIYNSVGANYVVSGAVWKLREVALSYDLPRRWLAPTKIVQHATLTISGRNLLMIRPKTNLWTDPEFSEDTGNDVGRTGEGQAPPTRIFSGTLSIQF